MTEKVSANHVLNSKHRGTNSIDLQILFKLIIIITISLLEL